MARCEERHPQSNKRCTLDAGHEEDHKIEFHTPEEREQIVGAMSVDGMKLVTRWSLAGYPPVAIAGGFLALYRTVADLREVDRGGQVREMLCSIAGRGMNDRELFVFIAEALGVSCDVIRIGQDQKTAS